MNKILKVLLLLLGGVYIVFQGMTFEVEGAATSAVLLTLLTILYYRWTENKNSYFLWFLVIHTIGQVLAFLSYLGPDLEEGDIDYFYYISNVLFIISYLFLSMKILTQLNARAVLTKLAIPIFILIILDIFCVSLVTATAVSTVDVFVYTLEYAYNAVVMILLSVALINYMYRNDNKSMMLLLGSICILFSEIIQLAYYNILDNKILGFIYSFLLVVAFIYFYAQSQLEFTGPEPEYVEDQLEA